jgi:hypothetical protein
MSEISDAARVQIFLADHAVADPTNKINALGVGFQVMALQANGFTAPCAVVAMAEFPSRFVGDDLAMELALYNDANELVTAPGLMGDAATPLRFGQNVVLQRPVVAMPGVTIPQGAVWPRHQLVAAFQAGIPLAVGRGYEWRVSIDSVTRPDWIVGFYVPAPSGGLVVG